MKNEFQGDREFCCQKFKEMVDDNRIQLSKEHDSVIIWTCEGNVGEYPMYGEQDCDGINYCPFCGAKV